MKLLHAPLLAPLVVLSLLVTAIVEGHPALTGRLGHDGAEMAQSLRDQWDRLALASRVRPDIVLAVVGLLAGLAYVCVYTVAACADTPHELVQPATAGRGSAGIVLLALVAHGAGSLAAVLGDLDVAGYYLVVCGFGAAVLALFAFGSVRTPPPRTGPGAARTAGLMTTGFLLTLCAAPLDHAVVLLGAGGTFPEIWYPLVRLAIVPDAASWALLAAFVAVAAALEASLHNGSAGTGWRRVLTNAAVYALLLGPSNPAKALALAFVTDRMARAGLSWPLRAAFLVASAAAVVALAALG